MHYTCIFNQFIKCVILSELNWLCNKTVFFHKECCKLWPKNHKPTNAPVCQVWREGTSCREPRTWTRVRAQPTPSSRSEGSANRRGKRSNDMNHIRLHFDMQHCCKHKPWLTCMCAIIMYMYMDTHWCLVHTHIDWSILILLNRNLENWIHIHVWEAES